VKRTGFIMAGLALSLLLAGVVSGFAAGSPDGLEHAARQGCTVNEEHEPVSGDCMARAEEGHRLAGGPLADYGWRGIDNGALATGLSGVTGVLITFVLGAGLFWLVRRRGTSGADRG
jgi:cobalt/nickel transport protein